MAKIHKIVLPSHLKIICNLFPFLDQKLGFENPKINNFRQSFPFNIYEEKNPKPAASLSQYILK